ncbi:MAG: nucleoside monophosphate kinase [Candidatus Wildermuthbacteria bacterium]|nr:nucleoside monophosphate kinase [Candidatus Wildermuthbacteria bacterium]
MVFLLSILGRPGAGKGTQVKILQRQTGFEVIRTGQLLRKRAKKPDMIGKKLRNALEHGMLAPTPLVFSLWMPRLLKLCDKKNSVGMIFDGNPRKLYEAYMLEELFDLLGWADRFRVCYIHISEEESRKRLLRRARFDDTNGDIATRLQWFRTEVEPVLDYYRKKNVLFEVNGEQSVAEVHKEMSRHLKRFLP